jgi:ATP-dependent RNA helicase RhlE
VAFSREKQALVEGADVIICTPGRMLAHIQQNYIRFESLEYLVLDEADRMLDMGFYDDIMRIVSELPAKRQTLMFSATMPPKIREMARKILKNPEEITIALSRPADKVLQGAYVISEHQKIPLAISLLSSKKLNSVLIFCSTKSATKTLSRELTMRGLKNEAIHSDLEQQNREKVLLSFRNKETRILVATDIVSRGIDVEDIEMVINYDVPHDAEDYIHRIGRTARAASDGIAITFISENDQRKFQSIERLLGYAVYKAPVPAEIGPSPEYNPAKFRPVSTRGKSGGGSDRRKTGKNQRRGRSTGKS